MKHPLFIAFLILDILLFIFWLSSSKIGQKPLVDSNPIYPEITELENKNLSFAELKKIFSDLANEKGAEYAFNVLKIAPVSPNTDMHLLGHVVGDVLYRQQGVDGIKICTEDFRNACSHSIVVGLLLDKGESALGDISAACRQAPGGSGAYTMCYHGLGHGVLAYTNFELPRAINLCGKVSQGGSSSQEAVQCIGGTIMEIISGGDHDKEEWGKKRTNYLKADKPFFPCLNDFMPQNARPMCLTYLTPYLWEAVGANLGNPTDADFEKSFKLCNELTDSSNRNICFGGFGKEFVGLAKARDIRNIENLSNQEMGKIYNWCKLADDETGIQSCLSQALSSIYWGGENDRSTAIKFCNIITDSTSQSICFQNLIGQVSFYVHDFDYRHSFCKELPADYYDECKKRLSV